MNKVPLTVRGADKLRAELQQLKTVDRPRIIAAIATAREHGDLKENAEYHAAREQQSFAEGRIQEIEGKLSNADIIDILKLDTGGRIVFGATVDLADEETGDEICYQIVGEDEANIHEGRVSYLSPLAEALLGGAIGDEVLWEKPLGNSYLTIQKISY